MRQLCNWKRQNEKDEIPGKQDSSFLCFAVVFYGIIFADIERVRTDFGSI